MGKFAGYKTYFICTLAILGALFGYLDGDMSLKDALEAGIAALAGITLRHGIETAKDGQS